MTLVIQIRKERCGETFGGCNLEKIEVKALTSVLLQSWYM